MDTSPPVGREALLAATEHGRIAAVAAKGQRDLQRCAAAYPELFSPKAFEPALFSNVAMAITFGAPWCSAEQLRLTNRAVLWGFALDYLVDHEAQSRQEVDRLTERCLAVADGGTPEPDDALGRLLAELRDELAAGPAFAAYRGVWREELRKVLESMAREWSWKTAAQTDGPALPGLDEYLANADNLACTIVNVTHWISNDDQAALAYLDALVEASAEVQRVLRLVNDLGTYERDLRWGDLNAIMLVGDRSDVERKIEELVARCHELFAPLAPRCPQAVEYLARQIGFSSGFYRGTDFWGQM